MNEPQKNEVGKIYLRYYQPTPTYVRAGGKEYICDVRHGVSMLVVEEGEVPALLAAEGGCCWGKRKIFSYASENAVKVWLTGNM